MSGSDLKDEVEFMVKMAKTQGVSCATVKDGHVLVFSREYLQKLLDSRPSQDIITMFVKRPDFNN